MKAEDRVRMQSRAYQTALRILRDENRDRFNALYEEAKAEELLKWKQFNGDDDDTEDR